MRREASKNSPLFESALLLVRLDYIARNAVTFSSARTMNRFPFSAFMTKQLESVIRAAAVGDAEASPLVSSIALFQLLTFWPKCYEPMATRHDVAIWSEVLELTADDLQSWTDSGFVAGLAFT